MSALFAPQYIHPDMTVAQRFEALLNMSNEALMTMVDIFNSGFMSAKTKEAMLALEAMIDCCG